MNRFIVFISIIIVNFTCLSFAQVTGSVSGTVTEKITKSFIPDVKIKILGTNFVTASKEDGTFNFENIPVGMYQIEFTSVAYQTYIESNVMITTGKEALLIVEMDEVTVDEVIVETSRFQKPNDVTTSYKSLTFEEIRRFPGGLEDIGRVLQSLPGVSLTSDGRNDLYVRGGSPSENLFLVDGFQVYNINHFGTQGATGGPVSILNLDLVRKVEFLTGGFSAKYGDKLSSVVDISLSEGNPDHFFGKVNLSGIGLGANLEGPLPFKNRGSWFVSARRSYLDFVFKSAKFSFIPEYTDVQATVNYKINDNNFFEFTSFGAFDDVKFKNDTEENKQNNERILTNKQTSYFAGLSWRSLFSSKSYAVFSLSRNYTNFFYSQRDKDFNEIFLNDSKEGDVLLNMDYFNRFGKSTFFAFGTGGKTIKLNYNIDKDADTLLVIDPETGNKLVVPGLQLYTDDRTYKAFAYVEVIQNFLNRFKLTAGLRYDYFDLLNNKNYISPRTSLSVKLSEKFNFNIAYGIFYQSPSYIWVIGSPSNKDLKDIRADHYIAGIEFYPDKGSKLTIEGFYKQYKNYPVSTVRPYLILANNGGFENQNSFGLEPLTSEGTGYSKGFEIFYQRALTKNFYGTAGFTFTDAKYTALDGVERRSDFDNRFVLNINAGYLLGKEWEFSAKFRLAGGRPYTPINPADGSVDYTKYNSESYPAYHRLDVRGEKRWFFKKWTLITYIDVQNIYNKQNIYQYRWDPYAKVIEENNNLGILPTIGITAEF
jgi:outer membrane receptor for ferrienterochelin and colicin